MRTIRNDIVESEGWLTRLVLDWYRCTVELSSAKCTVVLSSFGH